MEKRIDYQYDETSLCLEQVTVNGELYEVDGYDGSQLIEVENPEDEIEMPVIVPPPPSVTPNPGIEESPNPTSFHEPPPTHQWQRIKTHRRETIINCDQAKVSVSKDLLGKLQKVYTEKNGKVGFEMQVYYDEKGRIIEKHSSYLNASEFFEYQGELLVEHRDMEGRVTLWEYDQNNHLTREIKGDNEFIEKSYVMNSQGQVESRSDHGVVTVYEYDSLGQLSRELKGDPAGDKEVVDYVNDAAGNVISVSEGEGIRERELKYDVNNRITSIKYQPMPGKKVLETRYQYDKFGRNNQITDPKGRNYRYQFDLNDQMTEFSDPSGKRWRCEYSGRNLTRQIMPDGQQIHYSYDKSARNVRVEAGGFVTQRQFCENDNLLWARNQIVNEKNLFDPDGRHVGYEIAFCGSPKWQIDFELDKSGKKLAIYTSTLQASEQSEQKQRIYPTESVRFQYNDAGVMTDVTCGPFAMYFGVDSQAVLNRVSRGNNTETIFEYTAAGRISSAIEKTAGQISDRKIMQYNQAGDCLSAYSFEHEVSFAYDGIGQIIEHRLDTSVNQYQYDELSNRSYLNASQMIYDSHGILLLEDEKWKYTYDDNGFLREKASILSNGEIHQFDYSIMGQLIGYRRLDGKGQLTIIAKYGFGPTGKRVFKEVNYIKEQSRSYRRYYLYYGDNIHLELDENLEVIRQYVSLGTVDSVMGYVEKGKAYYYLRDVFGNVEAVLDQNGVVLVKYVYDPFGNIIKEEGQECEHLFRFACRDFDEESGTYHFRNRHYDPTSGRFLQPDPHPGTRDNPISLYNKYIFANNNPISYMDPHGLFSFKSIWTSFVDFLCETEPFFAELLTSLVGVLGIIAIAALCIGGWPGLLAVGIGIGIFMGALLVSGLIGGVIGGFTHGDSFAEGFNYGFKRGVSVISSMSEFVAGVVLGVVGFLGGALWGLRSGNWEGIKRDARLGWDRGYGTGSYIIAYPGELLISGVDQIFPDEFDHGEFDPYTAGLMSYLCELSNMHANQSDEIQKRLPPGFCLLKYIEDSDTDTQCYVARSFNRIYVIFEETEGAYDWILTNILPNLLSNRATWPHGGFDWGYTPQVAFSWWDTYESVRQPILNTIAAENENLPIYVAGHSLGAALASVAALDLQELLGREIFLYTSGSPRVGNQAFYDRFHSKIYHAHRMVNSMDMVSTIPGFMAGYVHLDMENWYLEDHGSTDDHTQKAYLRNIIHADAGLPTRHDNIFEDLADYLKQKPFVYSFMNSVEAIKILLYRPDVGSSDQDKRALALLEINSYWNEQPNPNP